MSTLAPASLASAQTTLAKRFGPVTGEPSTITEAGVSTLYAAAEGKRIRLKWLNLYSDPDNSAKVIAVVSLGSAELYRIPFPAGISAFAHASVREGEPDSDLTINLSAAQTVYANLDVEEF